MRYKTGIMIVLTAALAARPAMTQERTVFDAGEAMKHIRYLASDELRGRMSGEPGYQAAVDYAVSRFKEWGLTPGGEAGGFLQNLTFLYEQPESGASFRIVSGPRSIDFHYDYEWVANNSSGSGTFVSDVVFVGYGLSEPQAGFDEYDGLDVRGKLVLACTDIPAELEGRLGRKVTTGDRLRAAGSHGARGILLFRNGDPGRELTRYMYQDLGRDAYRKDLVILNVQRNVVDFMFKHQATELRYHLRRIRETLKPSSSSLTVKAFLDLRMVRDEARPTMNVLARIPGRDPRLRDEVVILGAHLDHLGTDMSGDIFNGADDNASGAAVVLEAARTMALNKLRPKRTIVFALWGAEETGLLGSEYYVEHPVYPLEKTAAYVNLDMEGHGNGRVLFEGVYYAPELWAAIEKGVERDVAGRFIPMRGAPGGSDHTPFMTRGVPTAFFDTDGYHFKTNRVGDVIPLISADVLKNAGQAATEAVEALASDTSLKLTGSLEARRTGFQWKARTIVNFQPLPIDPLIAEHGAKTDPDVDIQVALIGDGSSAPADAPQLLREMVGRKERIRECPGLRLYEDIPVYQGQHEPALHPGRTAVLFGVRGPGTMKDDPAWAEIFSRQGVSLIFLDKGDGLLDEKGAAAVKAMIAARLLISAEGLTPAEELSLLRSCPGPVFVQRREMPDEEMMSLIKKTRSVLGLIIGPGEDPSAYFQRLQTAYTALGADRVTVVAKDDLWGDGGRKTMNEVIGRMIGAGLEDRDIAALLGGSFTGLLDRLRGK